MQPFPNTSWTLILSARGEHSADSVEALESLCRSYWLPLYAFVRKSGWDAGDAEDITQAFFAKLIEKDYLSQFDQERGRFRSFLLACLRHFIANERDRSRAGKRGGAVTAISIDSDRDGRLLEPSGGADPEQLYNRQWAVAVLLRAEQRLRAEYRAARRENLFDEIRPFITGPAGATYSECAARLNLTEGAFKVAVHRMRKRFADALREEIRSTVTESAQVDEEIRFLFGALG